MGDESKSSGSACHAVTQYFHCQQHKGYVGRKNIVPILFGSTQMSFSQIDSEAQWNHAENIYDDEWVHKLLLGTAFTQMVYVREEFAYRKQ